MAAGAVGKAAAVIPAGGRGDGGDYAGGGGGSYIDSSGTAMTLASGVNSGNGTVVIGGVTFSYTDSIQSYTIPASGDYDILAEGAQGGGASDASGGLGAEAEGDFFFTFGTVLDIVGGGEGVNGDSGTIWGGSGGGGSFVYTASAVPEPASLSLRGAARPWRCAATPARVKERAGPGPWTGSYLAY